MPGYTHLQKAQPVLLSHHMLAYFEMLDRDLHRFEDCTGRVNVLPLGSGALAGTTLPIDRKYVARLLNFPSVSENSMDAVSDRDFIIEFLSASSLLMTHLSRLAEELVLWNSGEFGFIELPKLKKNKDYGPFPVVIIKKSEIGSLRCDEFITKA